MKPLFRSMLANTGCVFVFLATFAWTISGFAQEDAQAQADAEANVQAQANNPLANITVFNLQNYYIPSLSELDDQNANNFFLRYARPFGDRWLMRASLPFSRVPTGPGTTTSGVGDLNFNLFYLFDTDPATSFGVGPQLTLPTASEAETGTDKYQGGVSIIYFNARSQFFQWGALVTWQGSFAGDDDRPHTNQLAIQPFYFFQLGNGLYLRGAPTWAFDLRTDNYHVPVGLGIGKVVRQGNTVFNFWVEPQFTILDRGPGQPEFQIFAALNLQFY